ncbi:hypothetical protein FACS1894104_3720 [Actinomycetota bacterium]|nr:hypothetical protein FACS1894104_3720 [Actinomycetota bacterium]
MVVIHQENYTAAELATLSSALTDANSILNDASYSYTQADVDSAYDALEAALTSLKHDHPVLFHSRLSGVTTTGEDATMEFKGYFSDVISFSFGGKAYTLNSVATSTTPTLEILDGATPIGTITKGSAIVNLKASFLDTLANGTYEIIIGFADTYTLSNGQSFSAQGIGLSELVIERSNNPSPGGFPYTGDSVLPFALLALLAVTGTSCLLVWHRRRQRGVHVRR